MANGTNEQSGTAGENRWRWGPERNPYLHNTFTILELDDPDAPSRRFDRQVARLRTLLDFGHARPIYGYMPTQVNLAAAQDMATASNRLSEERLLVHRAHRLDLSALDESIRYFDALDPCEAAPSLPLPLADVTPIVRQLPPVPEIEASMVTPPDLSALMPLLDPDPRDEHVLPC